MDINDNKRFLLVTAHPDDECLFFLPVLTKLRHLGYTVFLLCLSTGNANGLGKKRISELKECANVLDIPSSNIFVKDDPNLQDGFNNSWPIELVKRHVDECSKKNQINNIITFDHFGVSGHPNHIAVYRGVRAFLNDRPHNMQGFSLKSENIFRKYLGLFDFLLLFFLSFIIRPILCFLHLSPPRLVSEYSSLSLHMTCLEPSRTNITSCTACDASQTAAAPIQLAEATRRELGSISMNVFRALRALGKHHTQLEWYRPLFVIFSSYTYLNSFETIKEYRRE
mmetsp:Transcript_9095/g.17117  ORF Transcript_9095/g.17117 Transcript_9095/m.17117 type:complete len:282 (-) Transcript_9095:154-999(-)